MRAAARVTTLLGIVLSMSFAAYAQSGVGIEVEEVVDNRMPEAAPGDERVFRATGGLELRMKLKGTNLDRVAAARVIVKDAKDDRGTVLADGKKVPDFTAAEVNGGILNISVRQPSRAAKSAKLKGTVELFIPTRDPNATVKIDKALSKLDKPLSSPKLKSSKIQITPLSPAAYKAKMEANKLTPEKKEKLRAEAKAQGVSDKEVEMMLGLAEIFSEIDGPLPANAVLLSGKAADFDRIFRVEILGSDGKPMNVGSRGTTTFGDDSIMRLEPSDPVPADAALQLILLTDKARMSVPFELTVPLP